MDPKHYYDRFSANYENGRDRGYHALVDDLESSLVRSYAVGGRVLEAGCGTGLVLDRIQDGRIQDGASNGAAAGVFGADLSRGMVSKAYARGLRVVQANLINLPYRDASFDVVCSFKVLAHVPDLSAALFELARVVRPGGKLVLEFYNRRSLRYLAKRLGPAGRIANGTTEADVFTRYDTLEGLCSILPPNVDYIGHRGIRVFTPWAPLHNVPVAGPLLRAAERRAFDSPLARLAGFLVVIAERTR